MRVEDHQATPNVVDSPTVEGGDKARVITPSPRGRAFPTLSGSGRSVRAVTEMPDAETRLLSEREQGRGPRERVEPVPRALEPHLRTWLATFLHPRLERRVAARLGLELTPRDRIPSTVGPPRELAWHPALRDTVLLDAIDLALQWDDAMNNQLGLPRSLMVDDEGEPHPQYRRLHELGDLHELLDDGGSTYRVWAPPEEGTARLISRVDPTVQASADRAGSVPTPTAGTLLRQAWSQAYSRDTDPDGAYRDAVRAVEVAISTVVSPTNDRQTLGTAIRDLRSGAHNYELVLLDKPGAGTVDPLVGLLERLWEGQKSRHGAGHGARSSTLHEARAAVQIAVLAVQWLTDGALRRRPPETS